MKKQIHDMITTLNVELKKTDDERLNELIRNSRFQLHELALYIILKEKEKETVKPEPGLRPIDPGSMFSDDQTWPGD